jgi:hypothetical protein
MKKILIGLFVLAAISIAFSGGSLKKEKYGVYAWMDTAYFMNVPYNSGAGIVALGIDTVAASPTVGKMVRKTASSASNTLAAHSYTATLTNTTNISTSSLFIASYIRMDSIVEVQITGQLTPTLGAGTNSELRFSLPITTSSATNQAWVVTGNFIGAGILGNQVTGIGGLVNTTTGQFFFQSNSTSSNSAFQIKFQYRL